MADGQDQPKPFNVLAQGFPQDLPQDQYDSLRQKYFDNVVRPRLSKSGNPEWAWTEFKKQTERPKMGGWARAALPLAQVATTMATELTKPLPILFSKSPLAKEYAQTAQSMEKYIAGKAQREGSSQLYGVVGHIAGAALPFALTEGATTPLLAEALPGVRAGMAAAEAAGEVYKAPLAFKMLKVGVAAGALEAEEAENGHRLTAGVQGFTAGMAFEGAIAGAGKVLTSPLGLAGKLIRTGAKPEEVDEIVKNAVTGDKPVTPVHDEIIADHIKEEGKTVKLEGRAQTIVENPKSKGVVVRGHTPAQGAGQSDAPWQVVVKGGQETAAVRTVQNYLRRGGVVDTIEHSPRMMNTLRTYLRMMEAANSVKLDNIRVEHTGEGQAPVIAREARVNGVSTEATGPAEVVSQDPVRAAPSNQEMAAAVHNLRDKDGFALQPGQEYVILRDLARIWEPSIPDYQKVYSAERLRNWNLGEMVPPQYRIPEDVPQVFEPTTPSIEPGEEPSEIERLRQEEIESKAPERFGTQRFQDIGTTTNEPQFGTRGPEGWESIEGGARRAARKQPSRVPPSEQYKLEIRPDGTLERVLYKVGVEAVPRPTHLRISGLTDEQMAKFLPPGTDPSKIGGFVTGPESAVGIAQRLGLPVLPAGQMDKPILVTGVDASKRILYHEGWHVLSRKLPGVANILREVGGVAEEIGDGLAGEFKGYADMRPELRNEEGYVHVAEAIRAGDANRLAELVRYDGTVDEVIKMVNDKSKAIVDHLRANDPDSLASRQTVRKAEDMIRRTAEGDRMWELQMSTEDHLDSYEYDPESRTWMHRTAQGRAEQIQNMFRTLKEMLDHVDEEGSGKNFAPSYTSWAETRGVRGAMNPRGSGPVKDQVNVQEPVPGKWSGWTAFSSLFRPMGPWVADLHERVNAALAKHDMKLPIYDRFKDVDEARIKYDKWIRPYYDELAEILKGTDKKQNAYLDVLQVMPKYYEQQIKALGLDPVEDLDRVRKMADIIDRLEKEEVSGTEAEREARRQGSEEAGPFRSAPQRVGMRIWNFVRNDWKTLRSWAPLPDGELDLERVFGPEKEPAQQSTFERLIRSHKLDPKSRYTGAFFDSILREVGGQKFMDKPLKEFDKLIGRKAANGSYLFGVSRIPLENFSNYMHNIPDYTSQVMNRAVDDFVGML